MSRVSHRLAMRSMRAMIAQLALVVALSLLGAFACEDSQHEVAPSLTATSPPTETPPPTTPPLPTPPADLGQRITRCIKGEESQQVASFLETCLSAQGIETVATNAEGEVPVVLLDAGSACTYIESYVLWNDRSGWLVQSLETLLNDGGYAGTTVAGGWSYRPDGSMAEGPTTRVVADGAIVRLGAVIGRAGCGSGPHASYLLLSLREGEWTLSWDAGTAFAGLIGQTAVEFSGEGIDSIRVSGTSYGRSDEKTGILSEHKLAPVRSFDQIWVRQGEAYILAQESVRASGSNTLLEFIYRLSSGDDAGVLALVTDASLVTTAQSLGLVRDPGDAAWSWYCTDSEGRALGPFVGWPCIVQKPDGSGFLVTFVGRGDDWLISAIDPCTRSYDPFTGWQCL